jgi:hypothetical protein
MTKIEEIEQLRASNAELLTALKMVLYVPASPKWRGVASTVWWIIGMARQ